MCQLFLPANLSALCKFDCKNISLANFCLHYVFNQQICSDLLCDCSIVLAELPHLISPTTALQIRNQLGQAGTPIILTPRIPGLQSQLALQSQLLTAAGAGNEMLSSPQPSFTQDPSSGLFYSTAPYDPVALQLGAAPVLTYAPSMEQSNVGMCYITCRK